MKKLAIASAVLVSLVAGGPAFADKCKSPKIKITNGRTKEEAVKVSKIDYFDACENKWRTESLPNQEIKKGASFTWTQDLGFVEGCKVSKFKVYRALRQSTGAAYGDYSYGAELTPKEGAAQECATGKTYTIELVD
jgi:hypothetical protein